MNTGMHINHYSPAELKASSFALQVLLKQQGVKDEK
jgi:hypothetical protein